jgi:hypothetical protein
MVKKTDKIASKEINKAMRIRENYFKGYYGRTE